MNLFRFYVGSWHSASGQASGGVFLVDTCQTLMGADTEPFWRRLAGTCAARALKEAAKQNQAHLVTHYGISAVLQEAQPEVMTLESLRP